MRRVARGFAIAFALLGSAGALVRGQVATTAEFPAPAIPFAAPGTPAGLIVPAPAAGDTALKVIVPDADPADPQSLYVRANAEVDAHQYAAAVADYSAAIKLRPDWAQAYLARGNAKERQNNLFGALEDFNHVLALDPQNAAGYERRGRMREINGEFAKALVDDGKALALRPRWSFLDFRLGVGHLALGQGGRRARRPQHLLPARAQRGQRALRAPLYLVRAAPAWPGRGRRPAARRLFRRRRPCAG
ncbi:MAG: tetratricopeptide repeat protein [Verrucomicrobiota bacterium]